MTHGNITAKLLWTLNDLPIHIPSYFNRGGFYLGENSEMKESLVSKQASHIDFLLRENRSQQSIIEKLEADNKNLKKALNDMADKDDTGYSEWLRDECFKEIDV